MRLLHRLIKPLAVICRGTDELLGVMDRVHIVNSTLGKALGGAAGTSSSAPVCYFSPVYLQQLVDTWWMSDSPVGLFWPPAPEQNIWVRTNMTIHGSVYLFLM